MSMAFGIKVIVQFYNDGWPSVGMNWQWPMSDLKTVDGYKRRVLRRIKNNPHYANRYWRIIDYNDNVLYDHTYTLIK